MSTVNQRLSQEENDMPAVSVAVNQISTSASSAFVRGHSFTMDRPEAKGGSNQGMMGGEALLAGLGGCFMSNVLAAAVTRGIPVSNVETVVTGQLAEEGPSRFVAINLSVSGKGCSPDEFAKLVTVAERGCIVANTLRSSVELSVQVVS
jgi:putative redox protein